MPKPETETTPFQSHSNTDDYLASPHDTNSVCYNIFTFSPRMAIVYCILPACVVDFLYHDVVHPQLVVRNTIPAK